MALKDYLLPEEEVIASCPSPKSQESLHATNMGVVSYRKGLLSERFHALSYTEITGITFHRTINPALLEMGVLSLLAGIALYIASLFVDIKVLAPVGLILLVLGVLLSGLSVLFRQNFCQLKGSGLLSKENEEQRWQLGWGSLRGGNQEAKAFVRAVREHMPAPVRTA